MTKKQAENVGKLLVNKTSEDLLKMAVKSLKITRQNWKGYLTIVVVCMAPSLLMGNDINTVLLVSSVVTDLLGAFLALFGIVFTGYAFFQALINKKLLMSLLKDEVSKDTHSISKFQEINESFVSLMILYMIAIVIALFLKMVFGWMPAEYVVFSANWLNNACATILIEIYLVFNGILLWRMISFLCNVFQLFNAHAAATAIEVLQEKDKN